MTMLHTSRLTIRPAQRADLDVMANWTPYPEPLDALWNWPHMLRAEGTADLFFLTRAGDPTRREWSICTDQTVVGYIHLRIHTNNEARAQIGVGLGYPYIRQGYGSESLHAMLPVCFTTLALTAIQLDVAIFNARARQLYDRLGFESVGTAWRPLGVTTDLINLDAPAYRSIRPFLEVVGSQIYALSVEMLLTAQRWHSS